MTPLEQPGGSSPRCGGSFYDFGEGSVLRRQRGEP